MKNSAHKATYWMIASLGIVASGLMIGASSWSAELAKVDGQPISDTDLRNALSSLNEGQRSNVLRDANSRHQILTSLIDQEVLVKEGVKEKMDQDAEYKEALNTFRKQYLASRVLQKFLAPKLTEAAAKKYYEAHKAKFGTDQVHAMHILTDTEEQAKEMIQKAKAPSADFQELAEKYSKDPSAKNNRGDLGFFGRDRMVPEFTDAAFAGQPGEIVGPVKTSYGYHIIKVIAKKVGKPLNYDEVELRVKNELREELQNNYVGKLRQQAKIQVNTNVDKM